MTPLDEFGNELPTFEQLYKRVVALEKGRDITLGDLPLADLQRKLENDWQPDAGTLLEAGSVAPGSIRYQPMMFTPLTQQQGGWPKSGTPFVLPCRCATFIVYSASMYNTAAGFIYGIKLVLDAVWVHTAHMAMNEASSHKQMTGHLVRTLEAGSHAIGLDMYASGGTPASDTNDRGDITVIALPIP